MNTYPRKKYSNASTYYNTYIIFKAEFKNGYTH